MSVLPPAEGASADGVCRGLLQQFSSPEVVAQRWDSPSWRLAVVTNSVVDAAGVVRAGQELLVVQCTIEKEKLVRFKRTCLIHSKWRSGNSTKTFT